MQILFMGLFAALAVAADQITKYLTVANIPLEGHMEFIPGVFGLTHFQNDGAAWSMFEGQQWLFAIIFAAFTVAVILEFKKNFLGFTTFERWCLAAIYAGGLGNMIDRLRFGFVVDMIDLDFGWFKSFPIFNVADCFITCGCIALIFHLVFFNKGFWKDGKKKK